MSTKTEEQRPEYMPHGPVSDHARQLAAVRAELAASQERCRALEGAIRDLVAPADRATRLVEGRS